MRFMKGYEVIFLREVNEPARPLILATDDDEFNLMIIEEILGATAELALCQSGEEALALAAGKDLILLDSKMPGMDGMTTLTHLKANDATQFRKKWTTSER